ncbi:MAG: SGNH/GDSL hydrolase family protein, partial [Mycobacteriales bacterium]
ERPHVLKLVGLALLAVVGLVLVLYPRGSDRRLADVTPTPSPSTASPAPTATPSPTGPPVTRAVVLGDSLSAGKGSPAGTPTATRLALKALGWDAQLLAVPGSGFTTGPTSFATRLAAVTAVPDVLVLQGGSSDTDATPEQLTAAAGSLLDQLARRFPHARVVVIGPVAMEQPPDGQLVRVDGTLRAVATAHHVAYVDPIAQHWVSAAAAPSLTAPAGYYPNAAGHALLGRRLVAALKAL